MPSFGSRESVSKRFRGELESCALVEAGRRLASAFGRADALLDAACSDIFIGNTKSALCAGSNKVVEVQGFPEIC